MQPSRAILVLVLLVVIAATLAQVVVRVRGEYVVGLAFLFAVFALVFIKTEVGLYLVLTSMLLSPEFAVGGGLAESRAVVLRLEDLLLVAIAFSWLAKTAVNKELGLVAKTPLNRWIVLYVVTTLAATLLGYLTGTVRTAAGFFYVLKYLEYFVVYYLTANNLRDRAQAWRLVTTAFLTATIVSLIGAAQIPTGQRVSAPFEGEVGEPNTMGGYLLFMIAIAVALALETERIKMRVAATALAAVMAVPFLFTLSRASYLGVVPMILALAVLSSRRTLMLGVLVLALVAAPLLAPSILPAPVARRVAYTFEAERGQTTVRLGKVAFDPSTSERLVSMQHALEGWMRRPVLGYGVTGFRFMDAQYARTLVETGIVGLAAFLALVAALLRAGMVSYRHVRDPEDRALALGFVAGTVGLLVHAVGANTFIIVRIMEPFWFFAAVVIALPTLERGERRFLAPVPAPPLGRLA